MKCWQLDRYETAREISTSLVTCCMACEFVHQHVRMEVGWVCFVSVGDNDNVRRVEGTLDDQLVCSRATADEARMEIYHFVHAIHGDEARDA